MKLALALGALLLICAISSISARPEEKPATTPKPRESIKDTIKKGREEQKKKSKECTQTCEDKKYEPVCAHDPKNASAKPLSFGSECVLQKHNCEHGMNLVVKAKGQCPNSEGIRLS